MGRENSSNNRRKPVRSSSGNMQNEPPRRRPNQGRPPVRTPRTNGGRNDSVRREAREVKRVKREPRRPKYNGIVPMIVFITVVIYLCGQMFDLLIQREETDVVTVQLGTLDTPERYTALAVRDEFLVYSDREGQAVYEYSEGDAVSKYALICTVKDIEETEDLEDKIYEIDQDILEQQKMRADLSIFAEDIARLESNIDRSISSNDSNVMGNSMGYVYDMKDEVSGYMSQRDDIWLSESVDSFASMSTEKTEYESQLSEKMTSFYTPASGILAFSYDGLEDTYNSGVLESITEAQVENSTNSFLSKSQLVEEGNVIYRIVEQNKWYLVTYLPNTLTNGWSKGTSKKMYLSLDDTMIEVTGKIELMSVGESMTKVAFSTYDRMVDFMGQRAIRFYFESETISGLKVPNDAIVEKSLLVIPQNCVASVGSEKGVMIDDGKSGQFVSVNVISETDEAIYIEKGVNVDFGARILYKEDDIFDGDNVYSTTQLEALLGVYMVNSSIAKFVSVEVLDQNQEYAIIKEGGSLRNYDSIVANAKNVTEGQQVY